MTVAARARGLCLAALWALAAFIHAAPEIPPDGSSVDALVTALYASVSHGPEGEPDWERLRNLFLPGAGVVPPKPRDADSVRVLTVDAFVDRIRRYIAGRRQAGETLGFTERETERRADGFGRICQVFSTYETVRAPRDPDPFARGIHSIQLVHDGRRWWIASLAWDTERPDNPILESARQNEHIVAGTPERRDP